jgi:hypothetical protein
MVLGYPFAPYHLDASWQTVCTFFFYIDIQILRRWISWKKNMNEMDYKYLKAFGFLHIIDENEKVRNIVETKGHWTHMPRPLVDKLIVTDRRIIIVKARVSHSFYLIVSKEYVVWEPYSISLDEIRSIELAKDLLPKPACDIIVNTSQEIKIKSVRKSIANEIVNYVNKYIRDRAANNTY